MKVEPAKLHLVSHIYMIQGLWIGLGLWC
jgi:hypothetical protein